jgi:hypothetical protein
MSNWCVSEEEARKAAETYKPDLGKLATVVVPPEFFSAVSVLEEAVHDTWAAGRIRDGWTWGPKRDDAKKEHPDIVPVECLSDRERLFDRNTAETAIKVLLAAGFMIIPPGK